MEQFIRDQEVAIDSSAGSVDVSMSGSPTARARSFLAHQRRSLSGDELAALLRELREPLAPTGSPRLSVRLSQHHLVALGDDGVQALLNLVDDDLPEFEGTMSASVEDETLTPTPSPESVGRGPDPQPAAADSAANNTIMGETDDSGTPVGPDRGLGSAEGEIEEQVAEAEDKQGGPEQAKAMEHDGEQQQLTAEEEADEREVSAFRKTSRSSAGKSGRRSSAGDSMHTHDAPNISLTPRAPIHRTPSTGGRTTTSVKRSSRLSQSLTTPASPGRMSPHQTPTHVERHGASDVAPAVARAEGWPTSEKPLPSVTTPPTVSRRRSSAGVGRSGSAVGLRDHPADAAPAGGSPVLRRRTRLSVTPQRQATAAVPEQLEDVRAAGDAAETDDEPYDADAAFDTPVQLPSQPAPAPSSSGVRSSPTLATPQLKASPREDFARKKIGSAFKRLLAGGRPAGLTSTPMSAPPRRTAGAARSAAHSRSLFAVAPPSTSKTPRRLALTADEDRRPAQPYTSGLIDDLDQDSDVSEEFPSATGTGGVSPQLRSPGGGRVSQLSVGSRAVGTPFVPSAESTRLSARPAGAPAASAKPAADDASDAAPGGPSQSLAADRSAASAGSPARSRSFRASRSGGSTPGQARQAPTPSASRSRTKSDSRHIATGTKSSAVEAFARLFPNFEHDQEIRRAKAAAKRRQSSVKVGASARRSVFGSHETRRWFRRNAVGLRVTPEALDEVHASIAKFEHLVLGWLRQVTGPNRATTNSDILAVLRRSGMATTEPQLRQLIRQHMPLEQQQELIQVAECGQMFPAENPLAED